MKEETVILSVRIKKTLLAEVKNKVSKKRISRNSWVNWAIRQGLRRHRRKTEPTTSVVS